MSDHVCSTPLHEPTGYVALYWDCEDGEWAMASLSPRRTQREAEGDAEEYGSPEHIRVVRVDSQPDPAAPVEMPWQVEESATALRNAEDGDLSDYHSGELREKANTLEAWARTHAQPVGMTKELEGLIAAAEHFIRPVSGLSESCYEIRLRNAIAAVRETYRRKG